MGRLGKWDIWVQNVLPGFRLVARLQDVLKILARQLAGQRLLDYLGGVVDVILYREP